MVGQARYDLMGAVKTESNDRRGSLSTSIEAFERRNAERTADFLRHDNDRPHVASVVKTYLEEQNWEILPYPPYLADIAPSTTTYFWC